MSYRQFYVWEFKLFFMFALNFILKGVGEMLCGFVCVYLNRTYRARLLLFLMFLTTSQEMQVKKMQLYS